MRDDLDLHKLLIYLKSKIKFDAVDRVTQAEITRTIEGASTLMLTLVDPDRSILRSGLLSNKLDVEVDGLWFRLVKLEKNGDLLDMTFEDREVAVMRTYNKLKFAHRTKVTRSEFVLNLVREVKEFKIPVVIPELHILQPIESSADIPGAGEAVLGRDYGIPEQTAHGGAFIQGVTDFPEQTTSFVPGVTDFPSASNRAAGAKDVLTVKGVPATQVQIKNANTILQVGSSMGANRKVLICSIMTAITESRLINQPGGDLDSVGLFQQREAGYGSYRERHDPATAARMFFHRAIREDKLEPTVPYWILCADVQRPREDLRTEYGKYRMEAERFATAFGMPGGLGTAASVNNSKSEDVPDQDFIFYRGEPKSTSQAGSPIWEPTENTWSAIQRMANEVKWRAFMVSGTFYFIAEDSLFKSRPIATITEDTPGIENIDGDYDTNKKNAQGEITARVGRWNVPPGAVIILKNMGPWNGRWLVTDYKRSLFDTKAEITIKKPEPRLPEPLENNYSAPGGWGQPTPDPTSTSTDEAIFGGLPDTDGSRNAVVLVAEKAYQVQQTDPYNYEQIRPIPDGLFSGAAHRGIDCSSFVTLVYKDAGASDPNGFGYNGSGYTGTLAARGTWVFTPEPGDLVFYGGTKAVPGHVGVYVGGGMVIEIGSDKGILKVAYNYRSDIVGYKRYLEPVL
jgi:cell wall-associated NlpC family hydrolase